MTNNPHRAMTEQYQQAPTETSRKTRASIATLGLAISMGATGLLLPRQGDHAIAAEPNQAPSLSSQAVAAATSKTHTVQANDTIATIARQYDVAPEALAAANHLSIDAVLSAGQQLTIPARSIPQRTVVSAIEPITAEVETATLSAPTVETSQTTAEANSEQFSASLAHGESEADSQTTAITLDRSRIPALPDNQVEVAAVAPEASVVIDASATAAESASANSPAVTEIPVAEAPSSPNTIDLLADAAAIRSIDRLQAQSQRLSQALESLAANTGNLLGSTTEAIELLALEPQPTTESAEVPTTDRTEETVALQSATTAERASADAVTPTANDLVVSIPTAADYRLTAVAVPTQRLDRPAVPVSAAAARTVATEEVGGGAVNLLSHAATAQSLAGAADVPTASSRLQQGTANSDLASPRYSPYIDGLRAEIQALQARYQNQTGESSRSGAISLLAPAAATAVAASQASTVANQAATVAVQPPSAPLSDRPLALSQPMPEADPRRSQLIAAASEPLNARNPRVQTLLNASVSPQLPPLSDPSAYLPGAQPQTMRGYIWPSQGILTSGYGWRWGRMHRGIDIAAPVGTPVVAAADGVVATSGWDSGGYGNKVDIRHPDGSLTRYAHNSRLLVRAGQTVRQGQLIAEMGSTGRSTGPHLHFEIRPSGKGAVNPMAFLPSGGLRAAR